MVEDPPVAWRSTPEAVYMVGTAGGLTGHDRVALDVEVAGGGHLTLRSGAATVVYTAAACDVPCDHASPESACDCRGTVHHTRLGAGPGATVDWAPEPLIVTGGARHLQTASLCLDPTARIDWTEVVLLGRHREIPGSAVLRLDCVLSSGRPLLRHGLTVGPGVPGWDGPAVLGDNRAAGYRLLAGAGTGQPSRPRGEGWAWMRLDGPGRLLAAVGVDLPQLLERMAAAGD